MKLYHRGISKAQTITAVVLVVLVAAIGVFASQNLGPTPTTTSASQSVVTRVTTLTSVSTVTTTSVVSASSSSTTKGPVQVRIAALAIIPDSLIYIAQDQGFFAKNGINATILTMGSGAVISEALLTGQLEFGHSIPIGGPFQLADTQNVYLKLVYPLAIFGGPINGNTYNQTAFLVKPTSGIKSISDFKGKTIAEQGPGSSSDIILRYLLTKAGINPQTDVTLSYLSFPNMIAALQSGSVDVAMSAEPFITTAVSQGLAKILPQSPPLMNYSDNYMAVGMQKPVAAALWAMPQYVQQNPEVAHKVATALAQTAAWMYTNQTTMNTSAQIVAKWTKSNVTLVQSLLKTSAYFPSYPNGYTDWQGQLTPMMNFLTNTKTITHNLNMTKFIQVPWYAP